MKRRHYRIHYNEKTRPMRRIKHKQISWGNIALIVLALIIIAVAVIAILKWRELGGSAPSVGLF